MAVLAFTRTILQIVARQPDADSYCSSLTKNLLSISPSPLQRFPRWLSDRGGSI